MHPCDLPPGLMMLLVVVLLLPRAVAITPPPGIERGKEQAHPPTVDLPLVRPFRPQRGGKEGRGVRGGRG